VGDGVSLAPQASGLVPEVLSGPEEMRFHRRRYRLALT
jgi:hypothetical protein